jgi:hypothetical protein
MDISTKRQLLFSVRMRFSPQTQSVRELAIDKVIEQNLVIEGEHGSTVTEIESAGSLCFLSGTAAIARLDLERGLTRLVKSGRVEALGDGDQRRYRLSQDAKREISGTADEAEQGLSQVVQRLFKDRERSAEEYREPFLHFLCLVFSRLGEGYVRHLNNDISVEELISLPSIAHAVPDTIKKFAWLEAREFTSAVYRFFGESDPAFAALKWNLAQNYYVAKTLGLDKANRLLSRQAFENGEFYLDTNVLIQALEPSTKHHRTFRALCSACKELGTKLSTCQISIDELRRTVAFERESMRKVLDSIPDEMADRVHGILFPIYRARLKKDGSADLDEIFKIFDEPMTSLEKFYGIARVDDKWFDQETSSASTNELVKKLRELYKLRRARTKNKVAATHDALVIRWIQHERVAKPKTWLVTLDLSLPTYSKDSGGGGNAFAITLDALLQWMSPVALSGIGEEDLAEVFSEAVRHHLLPQESFFELSDFLVFAEMEWATKELPAEDVEDCVNMIKRVAPSLNPYDACDREKLGHVIAKYFADPGRKFKQDLQKREAELAVLQQSLERLEKEHQESLERVSKEHDNERDEWERQLAGLKQAIADEKRDRLEADRAREDEAKRERLKRSARWRLALITLVFVVVEIFLVRLTSQLGEGTNFWQRLAKSWQILTAGPLFAYMAVCWVILGRDRLRDLGWPFDRLFKAE